jgi:glutathione S-transferase
VSGAPRLRLFSYLPNPRLAKATIAARLCGVELEIRGAKPQQLAGWLWDFDARPLEAGEVEASGTARQARTGFRGKLHKTDAFLEANPFGTVPVAFSPDGSIGIFESNSMLRAVARLGREQRNLYGDDPYTTSRIDSFLDASLVFARDSQRYLLALGSKRIDAAIHSQTKHALETYLAGMEQALDPDHAFLVGKDLTIADICFATELALFSNERRSKTRLSESGLSLLFGDGVREHFPLARAHYDRLSAHQAFEPDLGPYLAKLAGA